MFRYDYKNLQIPIASVSTAGGFSQASTNFYNVPKSLSQGAELEVTQPRIFEEVAFRRCNSGNLVEEQSSAKLRHEAMGSRW